MILSGDKTLLHPISLLMFRGYTIFLVTPEGDEKIHSSHATRVFNWHTEVLKVNSSSLPGSQSIPAAEHPRAQEPSPSKARASLDLGSASAPQAMSPSQSLSSIVSSHPASPPRPLSSVGVFTSGITSPRRNMSPLHLVAPSVDPVPSYSISPRMFTATTNPPSTPKSTVRSIPASEPPRSRAPSVLSFTSEAPAPSFGATHKGSANINPTNPSGIRAHMLDQTSPEPTPAPAAPRTWASLAASNSKKWGSAVGQGGVNDTSGDWGTSSGWSQTQTSGWETESSNWLSEPKAGPGKPDTEVPNVEHMQRGLQFGQFDTQPQPKSPKVDNSPFEPLLLFLRKSRAEGKPTVLRSVIGAELAKNKSVYQAAGVASFSAYVTLAAQRGLVDLGGVDGRDWVKLKS
ncbi:hypothetical protein P691DRAFT_800922 [Macrolepiota fuliginosa MF-IS2]|uniref:NYN domain-containing protein n=1 Tax=Macrolepiota fuliginosa MF-IS2 TaxID=1400762 RepID=A0A9P5XFL0_9AGAR|nr:hypothetical protein P691DRAFT_800922 [Macrolepiota fuliginosa MF-IS2]